MVSASVESVVGTDSSAQEKLLDVDSARADFPILSRKVHGKDLVYLDNAATTQKPTQVIERLNRYYREENANVHRGIHFLSAEATSQYEHARRTVQAFINAESDDEIVFTRGTTESINLVAQSFGQAHLGPGDEVLITAMEHHSNIVPWQMATERAGATLKAVPIHSSGELDMDAFADLLSSKTKLVAFSHVSNALGSVNPVKAIVEQAHAVGARVLVDGAQGVVHMPVDVRDLDCDFYVFSAHKLYGPTGIGALYGKLEALESLPPFQGGGAMIEQVTLEKTTYAAPPARFEAGTPHIGGAIGFAAAIDYVTNLGMAAISAHERDLTAYTREALASVPGLKLIGDAKDRAGVFSFVMDGTHPSDVATILDMEGVAVRSGHHCTQPLMDFYGVPATARASLGLYTNRNDIDRLVAGLHKVNEMFRH